MIVGFGTIALDSVESPFGRSSRVPGGSAIYFAAAASLVTPVGVLGVVGSDYPWEVLDPLRARGVDLSGVESRTGSTMTWDARYGLDLNSRDTLTDRGVAGAGPPFVPPAFNGAALLFLGSTDPDLQRAVLDRVAPDGPVVLDTMSHWIRARRNKVLALVERCRLLLVTESEAGLLAGGVSSSHANPESFPDAEPVDASRRAALAHTLLSFGPEWVVVKLGPRGAIAYSRTGQVAVPASPVVQPADPTGAGDAFAGGLVSRLTGSGPWDAGVMERALSYAACTAAIAVEGFGVEPLLGATGPEVEARVHRLAD